MCIDAFRTANHWKNLTPARCPGRWVTRPGLDLNGLPPRSPGVRGEKHERFEGTNQPVTGEWAETAFAEQLADMLAIEKQRLIMRQCFGRTKQNMIATAGCRPLDGTGRPIAADADAQRIQGRMWVLRCRVRVEIQHNEG